MTVFVDTGYFIALMIPLDQWHRAAARLATAGVPLATSSQVIGETISLLQIRGHFSLALEFLANLRQEVALKIVYPDAALQMAAWDDFKRSLLTRLTATLRPPASQPRSLRNDWVYRIPSSRIACPIHSRVSFSCTPFCDSRVRRLAKSTLSNGWS